MHVRGKVKEADLHQHQHQGRRGCSAKGVHSQQARDGPDRKERGRRIQDNPGCSLSPRTLPWRGGGTLPRALGAGNLQRCCSWARAVRSFRRSCPRGSRTCGTQVAGEASPGVDQPRWPLAGGLPGHVGAPRGFEHPREPYHTARCAPSCALQGSSRAAASFVHRQPCGLERGISWTQLSASPAIHLPLSCSLRPGMRSPPLASVGPLARRSWATTRSSPRSKPQAAPTMDDVSSEPFCVALSFLRPDPRVPRRRTAQTGRLAKALDG